MSNDSARRFQDSGNPYIPPDCAETIAEGVANAAPAFSPIARDTFRQWEKLRIIYVALLAVFCLALILTISPPLLFTVRFWATVVPGAVIANICFLAGPILETYVRWLGYRVGWLRIILFAFGTAFTVALAFGALVIGVIGHVF